jgi:hypothetical protein
MKPLSRVGHTNFHCAEADLSEGNNFNVASNDIERERAIPLLERETVPNSEEVRLVSRRSCTVINGGGGNYEVPMEQRSDDDGERDNSVLEDAETVDDDTEHGLSEARGVPEGHSHRFLFGDVSSDEDGDDDNWHDDNWGYDLMRFFDFRLDDNFLEQFRELVNDSGDDFDFEVGDEHDEDVDSDSIDDDSE